MHSMRARDGVSVYFISWLIYTKEKSMQCPLNRKLGGPQSQSRPSEKKYSSWPCWKLNHDSSDIQPVG
jgi:hypothetical protein